MREIKFRIWNKIQESYAKWYPTEGTGGTEFNELFVLNDNNIFQQFTGFKDKKNKDIYEGDIIEFKYAAGDFALQEMNEEEYEYEKTIRNRKFMGIVRSDASNSINLEIVCGNPKSTCVRFPLLYASGSKILGNIFENPKLKTKYETVSQIPH